MGGGTEKAAKETLCAKKHHSDNCFVKVKGAGLYQGYSAVRKAAHNRLHLRETVLAGSLQPGVRWACLLHAPFNNHKFHSWCLLEWKLGPHHLSFSYTYTQCHAHRSSSVIIFCLMINAANNSHKFKKINWSQPHLATLPAHTLRIHMWRSSEDTIQKISCRHCLLLPSYASLESFNLKFWILTWITNWAYFNL